ncbi:uncharacterized protein BKA78DRAFT_113496 [Phyllosticta capitalensis]|uniref:uncharacterized protein n=1 Tax=Phyllosticta capitalensis TaxID=121624 RepID=UPI00312E6AD6
MLSGCESSVTVPYGTRCELILHAGLLPRPPSPPHPQAMLARHVHSGTALKAISDPSFVAEFTSCEICTSTCSVRGSPIANSVGLNDQALESRHDRHITLWNMESIQGLPTHGILDTVSARCGRASIQVQYIRPSRLRFPPLRAAPKRRACLRILAHPHSEIASLIGCDRDAAKSLREHRQVVTVQLWHLMRT